MKIDEPLPSTLAGALGGDLAALDALIAGIGPGVHALAVRMLGNREDAADASQEILLKVVTHLAAFRGEARFSTWVWSIARHHLLTASTRSRESPEVSLEALAERLESGLEFADRLRADRGEQVLTPQDKVEARQIALGCTQSMLMTLDREHRLAYVLDLVFGLDSAEAHKAFGVAELYPCLLAGWAVALLFVLQPGALDYAALRSVVSDAMLQRAWLSTAVAALPFMMGSVALGLPAVIGWSMEVA